MKKFDALEMCSMGWEADLLQQVCWVEKFVKLCLEGGWGAKVLSSVKGLRPHLRKEPSMFLIKDYLNVIVAEKGDSTTFQFKFDFLMQVRTLSQVSLASNVEFYLYLN